MKTKVIGIGNRIMRDDSIGIKVVEALKDQLRDLGFQVIIGETDIEYTLNYIENGDYIIIVDSSLFGIEIGEVSVFKLNELKEFSEKGYSLHQMSLVKILSNFSFLQIEGKLITIESSIIDFGTELSKELEVKFDEIKEKVIAKIRLIKDTN
ncbi:hydrogenase maturation protease [Clostridium sp.]|uniref:hydrogenase maturation protease n=1 Tax=Clostridium sp. TaxID=1506 RepID=UPI002FC5E566